MAVLTVMNRITLSLVASALVGIAGSIVVFNGVGFFCKIWFHAETTSYDVALKG
jgi:hypothetical protein